MSPSVLTERLTRLEEMAIVRRRVLPPPAGSTVYELTPAGESVRPAVLHLIRWGGQFLLPPRRGERLDPGWLPLSLAACARGRGAPPYALQIRLPAAGGDVSIHVKGRRQGTVVTAGEGPADLTIAADAWTVLGVALRQVDARQAVSSGRMRAEGKLRLVPLIPEFFDASPA